VILMAKPLALIIEDNRDISFVFSKVLESAGFETEIASAGDVAMERLSSITPDVVTLDLSLPRVSGEEILRYIRSDARMADTKVIVITAYGYLSDDFGADADLVLVKPINLTQLRDLATRLVGDALSDAR
jgi:DNA-binding response OmpR family regulator